MSNDLAKLINGPADEKIASKIGNQSNRSPTKSQNPKTHKCQNRCSKRFSRSDELTRYKRTHDNTFKKRNHRNKKMIAVSFKNLSTLYIRDQVQNKGNNSSSPLSRTITTYIFTESITSHPNSSWQKPFNCPINGCMKNFTRHGYLSRHIQSCQSKCNRKENEKPVHPPSPITSCIN
ncbi:hypothetical protein GLOIN_2v1867848 [Rhizophagus irregularis DAOM 181602=DAOM 197198]|uniref:C2H2-type domain-containing protein n=1 Tax=Rhizophagus irregularis (strain DAOM 181602 / DAOM 197198 / MUCL 43194) TaxID=747089 RepID=U9UAN7_RHIID|nr:hypothetical protein GLOIN_2v1867848 [Rhizophagus irregularis DAOM 181602=DAOM 197198]POG81876.1 hypothetical protein GLOIN_2v1867848 [Rhizophagus irregularis DAOM 181602=DAOM 197198]CAG8477707.1 16838_t:CDS:2 [Rhizophagus irregularis]|eukprot:XP_025188742.1 hypothetical protein GLOIN_2v1867848 [Rhizophagus irregularis DAOM 181602=DAOM 197198]